jgi:hypothetical protein
MRSKADVSDATSDVRFVPPFRHPLLESIPLCDWALVGDPPLRKRPAIVRICEAAAAWVPKGICAYPVRSISFSLRNSGFLSKSSANLIHVLASLAK